MLKMSAFEDESLSFEVRAKDLVSKMTLEEKVSQMRHNSPSIPRLGIPSYNWWNEALHGVARAGVSTSFPQAIGMAATFNEDLIYKASGIISTEARAKYHEFQRKNDRGIFKGLTFWSPNINIFRDPRWGRGQETYGEDPYLTGKLGVAFVRGLQGNDPKYLKAAACAKHYAAHSGPEKGRGRFEALVSEKDLRETYLYAFKECVKKAKVEAIMGAYNMVNGEPCCGSETLIKKILREEWGFKGYFVSDCWALMLLHEEHRVTATAPESAALAVNNGCDLECGVMFTNLLIARKEGLISEGNIDSAVTRLMITRMKLGMFDKPENVPFASIPYDMNDCNEHKEYALKVTKESLVLLKNENNLLPLDKNKIKSIAIIGPNANSRIVLKGNYFGTASQYITVLDGVRDIVPACTRVYYSKGCHLFKDKVEVLADAKDRFTEALSIAEQVDAVVMCLGLDSSIEGEGSDVSEYSDGDRIHLSLPGVQQELLQAVQGVGRPVVLVLFSGGACTINWADENIPAIIQAWYPGAQGGKAIASMIFGEFSPSGRLPVTFYRTLEELPAFSDYSMKNRTYRYMSGEALYPFGFGLSYTKFGYKDLKISNTKIKSGESMECSVIVQNSGKHASLETVQLYLKDMEASVNVPKWQLSGIQKVDLMPGEEKEVKFIITPRQMALIGDDGKSILEPGEFRVYVGGSQPDERSRKLNNAEVLSACFEVVGEAIHMEY